ncbi:MAG: D-amino-acid oxidase, partial [Sinorhizobium fredii]|nr:D-amino-acid oxidase [Sinorhizobium fredii]
VIERWAGLRPKATGREPMVGRHPDHQRLSVLTGGFKVSFGMAHVLAGLVIDEITGQTTIDLPQSFRCETHIAGLQ